MSLELDDLTKAADYLADMLNDLEEKVAKFDDDYDATRAMKLRETLTSCAQYLSMVRAEWDNRIGERTPFGWHDVPGVGRMRALPNMRRSQWQSEDLVRAVLDTHVVDPQTGEIADETPIEKVRQVWPLAGYQARVGALKKRGLDPGDFCTEEKVGWRIESK